MAHYAFLNDDNIVQEVLVGIDENDLSELPNGYSSWEEYYTSLKGMICKRTSYNTDGNQHDLGDTPFRGNYAGIGHIYDAENDVFYQPQPHPSWTISEETNWQWKAPVDYPADGDGNKGYIWNENTLSWDEV